MSLSLVLLLHDEASHSRWTAKWARRIGTSSRRGTGSLQIRMPALRMSGDHLPFTCLPTASGGQPSWGRGPAAAVPLRVT